MWLDNISRTILDDGTLERYIDEFAITGLTSNPTIFEQAIGETSACDDGIRTKAAAGRSPEALFLELALEDLRRAAAFLRPVFDATLASMVGCPWRCRRKHHRWLPNKERAVGPQYLRPHIQKEPES